MFQPIDGFPSAVGAMPPQAIGETGMPLSFEGLEEPQAPGGDFASMLSGVLHDIEAPKAQEEKLTMDLLAGKPVDTHEVMIAGAQGDMMLQMASSVVSKVANAYQTLLNMQV